MVQALSEHEGLVRQVEKWGRADRVPGKRGTLSFFALGFLKSVADGGNDVLAPRASRRHDAIGLNFETGSAQSHQRAFEEVGVGLSRQGQVRVAFNREASTGHFVRFP